MRKQSEKQSNETLDIVLRQNDEMREYIMDLLADQDYTNREISYLYSYISYKGLNEDYRYFRDHAYEKHSDDQPFPTLTL